MARRKTDSDYKREVWDKSFGTITLRGVIKNEKTHVIAKCKKCGIAWVTTVVQLRQNNGCKYCHRLSLPHWKRYCKRVQKAHHGTVIPITWWLTKRNDRGRIVIYKQVLARCACCGHIWSVPSSRLIKHGCPRCGLKRAFNKIHAEDRRTTRQFKRLVEKLHPHHEYSVLSPYINARTKVKVRHNKCGYVWWVSPDNFLKGTQCPRCVHKWESRSRSHTTKWFKAKVRRLFPHHEYSVLSPYIKGHTKIEMRHNTCGYVWKITPFDFLNGTGYRCPRCSALQEHYEKRHTTKWFKHQVHQLYPHHEYSVLSKYIDCHSEIKMRHNVCGHTWWTLPDSFLEKCKYSRCPRCSERKRVKAITHTNAWFVNRINRMYPDKRYTVLTPYIRCDKKIKVRCNRCGHIWYVEPSELLLGRNCPFCSASRGEHMVALWLDKFRLGYIYGYKLNIFKSRSRQPHLDFKLKHYRIGIEFDGVQHFRPVKYFGGKRKFKSRHEHDLNKDLYCSLLGITLIRIEDVHGVQTYKKLHRLVFKTLNQQLLPLIKKINKSRLIRSK